MPRASLAGLGAALALVAAAVPSAAADDPPTVQAALETRPVDEADGADVEPRPLGLAFRHGVLVTQDGDPSGPLVDPARESRRT
jgi:hypothetical protein